MHRVLGLLTALALLAAGPLAASAAQESTPTVTVEATLAALLQDADGVTVAVALLAEGDDGEVSVGVTAVGLDPGPHGIHIHETGVCDPEGERAFASAGGHYNPEEEEHGEHAGDLGNIDADDDGTAVLRETTDAFGLDELLDEDGTAIVIHAEEDEDDPEGESYGARIACGVLAAPITDAAEPTTEAAPDDSEADTDGDGLSDADETGVYGTDPEAVDTDGDGAPDGDEVNAGTDPLDPADFPAVQAGPEDTDGDGASDEDEIAFGSDPNDPSDFPAVQAGPEDTDGDGLFDDDEVALGTDPDVSDTDGDGFGDNQEVVSGTDPLDPASL